MIPLIDTILGRVPCHLHEGQIIQNFCKRRQCLKQLCPKCITIHTQEHHLNGTVPDYEAINLTVQNCAKLIDNRISQSQKVKLKIERYQEQWEDKKKAFEEQIWIAEKQTVDQVLFVFEQLRNKFKKSIEAQEKAIGIKNGSNFERLYCFYDEQIQKMQKVKKDFKSMRGYAHIKPLVLEVLPRSQRMIKETTDNFIQSSQRGLYLHNQKQRFHNQLREMITLNFNLSFGNKLADPNSTMIISSPFRQNTINCSQPSRPSSMPKKQGIHSVIYANDKKKMRRPNIENNICSSVIFGNNMINSSQIRQSVEKEPIRKSSIFNRTKSSWNIVQ